MAAKWVDPDRPFSVEEWVEDFHTTEVAAFKDANAGPGGVTEDCLFLDVHVPKKVLEGAFTGGKRAPVLVSVSSPFITLRFTILSLGSFHGQSLTLFFSTS